MFRLFQVNTGVYLQLDHDVPPTAQVRDLCTAVESISGEGVDSQVLLTADGQQMDPIEVIGSYSIGTDSKPIFIFYKSYSDSPSPPYVPSRLKRSPDLQRQMELLKPSPALFQHQAALAKLLGEYASDLGAAAMQLAGEYGLQLAGWDTVLNNCSNIIRTYQKHHLLFCRAVGAFQSSRQHYLDLINKFPRQVRILQDLPLPQGGTESTAQSLYDWISTHDEKNSLDDLSNECQKALAQVENEPIQMAISNSENILALAAAELSPSHTQQFKQRLGRLQELAGEATELTGIQNRLAENIQSTSQRALRSGDAGTIADLVVSHHSSLQLMTQHNAQLEGIAREMEDAKTELRGHLHSQLHSVTKLQMKLAESNSQLVLQYERVKVARKRFDVLEQVCSAPDVLAQVVAEVERRRAFRNALQQKAEVLSYSLGRACEEEREMRQEFLASCQQHFITTLFPDLHTKAPDLTVQLSRGPPEEGMDLSGIKKLLPTTFSVAPLPSVLTCGNQQAKYSQTDYQAVEAAVSKCVVGAATQTDRECIETATQTDHECIETATQTDHECIETATQTDHECIETATQTDHECIETATQTDHECVEATGKLRERVRELEQQFEVSRSEGARLGELLATESEGSKQATERLEQLVDTLKQQVNTQQLQLEQQCEEHRAEQSRLREQAEELERSKVRHQQAQAVVGGLRDQLELAEGRIHSLEEEKQGLQSTLEREECESREKVEAIEHQMQLERDSHMKLCMELEREVKELRRAVEVESSIAPQEPQKPPSSKAAVNIVDRIAVSGLREGDTALFMTDAHGNYLALSIDGRTYYLNHSCIASFSQDLNSKVQHLNFRRKLLLGRITERMFVEVRKEGNRLHAPVGSRLYKVHAEEVIVP